MNRIIAWFAQNGVAANLMMILIIAAGILTLGTIKLEVFPEMASDMITVTIPYPGAAPEEVEKGVCIKVEEAVQDIEGIRKIRSKANEGLGTITIEVEPGYDGQKVLDDIKSRVDGIDTFPLETEKPVVRELVLRREVINIAISGDTDERTLKMLGERVRDELLDLPEITQVSLSNTREFEIAIELSEESLRRYNLTFDEVARAVRMSSIDLPGGVIKTPAGEILLRTQGQSYTGHEFEQIVLRSLPDGTRLHIGDVARVVDGFADTDQFARFDGKKAILVKVYRVGDESALAISAAVKNYITENRHRVPEGIEMTPWQDDARILKSRLDLMIRNGRAGFILVFLSLALFLKLRLAGWVSLGLVLSFFGAFWLMPMFGVSINLISLFAFIVVLGIVVDDAIVVGENVHTHIEKTGDPLMSAIRGAQEVAVPVTFAVLTTVAAFAPLLDIPGTMGKFMRVIPIVVISTLVFSLLESLLILPSHLAHTHETSHESSNRMIRAWKTFQARFSNGLKSFANNTYRRHLELALHWRYTTLATGIATLLVAIGLIAGGWLKFFFFPTVDADNVIAILTMPQGTPAEVTAQAITHIEDSAEQLRREIEGSRPEEDEAIFRHILTSIGEQPFRERQSQRPGNLTASFNAAHLGEVNIELAPSEERSISSSDIAERWRELTGPIPDAVELVFSSTLLSTGEPINIQLKGTDYDQLALVARKVKERLAGYAGVFDITDSYRAGKEEIRLSITPEAQALGLTLADLGRQVRQAFYGEEAQRIQRGRDDIRVMVRFPEQQRRSLAALEDMRIRLPNGVEVPFSVAARAEISRGFSSIDRADRRRTITVTADVDPDIAVPNKIIADMTGVFLPELLKDYPEVSYSLEGQQREQNDSIEGLIRGFIFALLAIYALLAIPFRSYIQPVIVMSAIPFGIVGAIFGHIIMGLDLTILSGFGIVALTGVVVNDSLVMVDFINRARAGGLPLAQAIRDAGVARFRPILLTSLTTFLGLTPLLLEKSLQAQFLIPMAVSLGFGVLFATAITLILIPVLYYILEDTRTIAYRLVGKVPPELTGRPEKLLTGEEG